MADSKKPLDGEESTSGEFWIIVATEADIVDHQTALALTTLYPHAYDNETEANAEAVRLAEEHRGYEFAVLKSQAIAKWRCDRSECREWPASCRFQPLCKGRVKWQDCEPEARLRVPTTAVKA